MTPTQLVILMAGVTLVAIVVQGVVNRRRAGRLQALARRWQMHYSRGDRFRLAERVAGEFPVCGAADVRISDLIYGASGECYRYVFTADYTQGVIRTKRRQRRVVQLREAREPTAPAPTPGIEMAPGELGWLEQYEHFRPTE